MKFTETYRGIWKSDITAVSAMMLAGEEREPKGIHEPRFKTLEAAIKAANKEMEA